MSSEGYPDPENTLDSASSESPPPPLPTLTDAPKTFSGCCLGLSLPLLNHVHMTLSAAPGLVISIGSGYGLLEALLLSRPYSVNIIGVEVQPSSNQYLPPSHHRVVAGSRFLDSSALKSAVWLFVYPKRVGLVGEYVKAYGMGLVQKIIWAGPKLDWDDYRPVFLDKSAGMIWRVETRSADEIGGHAWEMLAIATKLRIP
ncbi:uncharacterized protein EI97DRAFT_430182 [Westerdykella ornata]|uniref:S-adenosyl-L-methionine-dependent methyltransferase n=1 Tax=Westerdykella ornata TaxID=318751 RepID=A0A6A6JW76_WESOR|nr:uncharacterized protein EI97DRAFT_430182 [Westerdykella ornata]KAF2280464.1 hypothetical protein EI97DRAFT_430182 [Westerdykella ornata]